MWAVVLYVRFVDFPSPPVFAYSCKLHPKENPVHFGRPPIVLAVIFLGSADPSSNSALFVGIPRNHCFITVIEDDFHPPPVFALLLMPS